MLHNLSILLASLILVSACGKPAQESPGTQESDRFEPNAVVFLKESRLASNAPAKPGPDADCRAHIKEVMCLADQLKDDDSPVECLDGGVDYAAEFETLYDNLTPAFQKMFCSLRIVYVLKNFQATAFAGIAKDKDGNPIGAQMGIRKSVLDERLDLSTWATWKEQLSFGGNVGSYEPKPELPAIAADTKISLNLFLYMVVTHEFGHMFDFSNSLNKVTADCPEWDEKGPEPVCKFEAGSWGALSWETTATPTEANRFPFRPGLCFYGCRNEPMTKAAVPDLYAGLTRSSFISAYAATNPWDDFAEVIAYHAMSRNLAATYAIDTKQGLTYDMISRIDAPELKAKREYLEQFLARPDIVYP